MTKRLSVVPPDAPAPKPVRRTIVDAVQESERDLLVAMRAKIAAEIDSGVPAHALSALVRQLRELDKDIRNLDAREREAPSAQRTVVDDRFDASAI